MLNNICFKKTKHSIFSKYSIFSIIFILILFLSFLTFPASGTEKKSDDSLSIGLSVGKIIFFNSEENSDIFASSSKNVTVSNTGHLPVDIHFYILKNESSSHYSLSFFNLSEEFVHLGPGESFNLKLNLNPPETYKKKDLIEIYKSDDFSDLKLHILYKTSNLSNMSAGFRVPIIIDVSGLESSVEEPEYSSEYSGSFVKIVKDETENVSKEYNETSDIYDYDTDDSFLKDKNGKDSIKSEASTFESIMNYLKSYPLYSVLITLLISVLLIAAAILGYVLYNKYKSDSK
ncbi:MAG: hypothetical protein GX362_06565 [Methanosarcinaceae archaeon]|nr:hypothetical protein [Methanosarcinaceae archaeon]